MTALHPRITPARISIYQDARQTAFSAGNDWSAIRAAANVLSRSPDHADQSIGQHLIHACDLRDAGLLRPAPIRKADLLPPVPEAAPTNPRRGTIREGLRDMAVLLGFGAVVLTLIPLFQS